MIVSCFVNVNSLIPFIVTEAPQFMELLKSTAVVVPNDVILRCNLKLGKPEADIKW